jgi:UDP-glucose 4-epimerase
MNVFVTGGAGFVGSHIVDAFLAMGAKVVVYDRLSSGREEFLSQAQQHPNFVQLIKGDVLDLATLTHASFGTDILVHCSANADLKDNANGARRVFEQNTLATFHILEVCRINGIKRLVFPSSCAVYGPHASTPTPENSPLQATSLYAASKIAGEAMVQAYCETFGLHASIFRFVSLMGERYTHGLVVDFVKKMRAWAMTPKDSESTVEILGDGHARKDYLYVGDAVSAIMLQLEKVPYEKKRCDIYNLGTGQAAEVDACVAWIADELGMRPTYTHTGGAGGWVGDNPLILPSTEKIRALGWSHSLPIESAMRITAAYVNEVTK